MRCGVDWPLVLEFTKALAGPVATVTSVVLVARFALSKYRTEKVTERRLQWYDAALSKLGEATDVFGKLEGAIRAGNREQGAELYPQALRMISVLAAHFEQALLYAPQSSIDVIQRAMKEMTALQRKSYEPTGTTPEIVRELAMECMVAAAKLSEDARRELGIPQVRWPTSTDSARGN